MGLDVSAYCGVELIDVCDLDTWEAKHDWEETVHIWPALIEKTPFPEQLRGSDLKPNGVYEYKDRMGFRAGSYSGYGRWRAWLSRFFMGAEPQDVWTNPADFRNKPFFFLANFSDCEGIIAGDAVRKLCEDFAAHRERVHKMGWSVGFVRVYDLFHNAFAMAVHDGFVEFH